MLGALFLSVIGNALPVLQVSPFWQSALTGLVILVAVLINARGQASRSRQILPLHTTAKHPGRMKSRRMNAPHVVENARKTSSRYTILDRKPVFASARCWAAGKACWRCCWWPCS
jgi:hypothetical protein